MTAIVWNRAPVFNIDVYSIVTIRVIKAVIKLYVVLPHGPVAARKFLVLSLTLFSACLTAELVMVAMRRSGINLASS